MRFMTTLLALALALLAAPTPALADLDVEDRAPNFSWREGGSTVDLRDLEGRWVAGLLFIDPRSERCLVHLKEIDRDAAEYRRDEIRWVAVVLDYGNLTRRQVNAWIDRNDIDIPVVFDDGWRLGRAYDLDGPCDVVLVDADGDVNFTGPFPRDLDDRLDALRATLDLDGDGRDEPGSQGRALGHRHHDEDEKRGEGHHKDRRGDDDDDDDRDDDDDDDNDDNDDDDDDRKDRKGKKGGKGNKGKKGKG
ncbi:MAG TPA: redoxin domain-containing protein [bacterium]|nr:redoxin domain-containing protein [bacterium]